MIVTPTAILPNTDTTPKRRPDESLARWLHRCREERLRCIAAKAVADRPKTAIAAIAPKPTITEHMLARGLGEPIAVVSKAAAHAELVQFDLRPLPVIALIQREVAREYEITVHDMRSARRTANVTFPRQIAMYLAKEITLHSMPEIGRRFGGRDHTTVLHAQKKIIRMMDANAEFAAHVAALRTRIEAAHAAIQENISLQSHASPAGDGVQA